MILEARALRKRKQSLLEGKDTGWKKNKGQMKDKRDSLKEMKD